MTTCLGESVLRQHLHGCDALAGVGEDLHSEAADVQGLVLQEPAAASSLQRLAARPQLLAKIQPLLELLGAPLAAQEDSLSRTWACRQSHCWLGLRTVRPLRRPSPGDGREGDDV